ncbi:MAG: Fe-S oxidoreductase, partial [Flavobacteriaceae bacterium]|nr:Fe-S oxidoreductase [Flavobacteriaceae bacterium]
MLYLPNIIFTLILAFSIWFFTRNIHRLMAVIRLGRDIDLSDNKSQRWKNMAMISLGQSKMVTRPLAGILHIIVYVGFIVINIEVLEIIIDGVFGTHRIFSGIGPVYGLLIGIFEVLAVLVFVSVVIFWTRRNLIRLKRFWGSEMTGWPRNDANNILYFEMVLMGLFLIMNATDVPFQDMNSGNWVSGYIAPWFSGFSENTLHLIERAAWWFHIIGILGFLNYLYYSKHLHILLAFPNTFYGRLVPNGQMNNLESVMDEVKLMMDPNADPFAAPADDATDPGKFGASDVLDLNWFQLLNAYTCTECGRCTSVCPANQTGKK